MNAIIQMVHTKVMGSVIDAIEYYLVSKMYSDDIYLVFFSYYNSDYFDTYKQRIINLINNRYNYRGNFENNIVVLPLVKLLRLKLNKALIVDWGTIPKIRGLINSKELYIISELSDKQYMLDKNKYNATYFGEMPFVYKDIQYNMKFAFDFYPKLTNIKQAIYINSPNNDYSSDGALQKIASMFNRKILLKKERHEQNLFEQFDTYLYYHANKYFDPHPRLFHECYFYDKKIHYVNQFNIYDGSYFRYKDLLKNGLNNRLLTKEDEIIQLLIH